MVMGEGLFTPGFDSSYRFSSFKASMILSCFSLAPACIMVIKTVETGHDEDLFSGQGKRKLEHIAESVIHQTSGCLPAGRRAGLQAVEDAFVVKHRLKPRGQLRF